MKFCPGCSIKKPYSEFQRNKIKNDGYQSHCRKCKSRDDHKYYLTNKEVHYARVKSYLNKNRLNLWNYLKKHSCIDCGETNPIVLEFDHLSNKKASVAWLIGRKYSWKVIKNEIKKCKIRCANCHRIKTSQELGWYRFLQTE